MGWGCVGWSLVPWWFSGCFARVLSLFIACSQRSMYFFIFLRVLSSILEGDPWDLGCLSCVLKGHWLRDGRKNLRYLTSHLTWPKTTYLHNLLAKSWLDLARVNKSSPDLESNLHYLTDANNVPGCTYQKVWLVINILLLNTIHIHIRNMCALRILQQRILNTCFYYRNIWVPFPLQINQKILTRKETSNTSKKKTTVGWCSEAP